MDEKTQLLKNAIDFAKKNPDAEQSKELRRRMEAGYYDREISILKGETPMILKERVVPIVEAGKRTLGTFQKLGVEVSTAYSNIPNRALEGSIDPKTGKSTILRSLVSAPAAAGEFLGRTTGAIARGVGALIATPFDAILTGLKQDKPEQIEAIKNSSGYKMLQDAFKTENVRPEVKQLFEVLSEKAKDNPEVAQSLKDAVEVVFLGGAGQAEKQLVSKGKNIINTIEEAIPKSTAVSSTAKATTKAYDEALKIVKPEFSSTEKELAMKQGRVKTSGILRKTEVSPDMQQQRIADSVSPLVSEGRVSARALPEKNIEEISREVSRINSEVKNFIADNKVPFNEAQLRAKLNAVRDENNLVFASEPNIQRTFDALIDEFITHVKGKDTAGLFEARQSFDKIPAVKKLLESEKMGENVRRQLALDVRRAANEYVSELLPPNNPYKALLENETHLIRAIENIAGANKGRIDTNAVKRLLKQYPWLTTIVGIGATGTGVGILSN